VKVRSAMLHYACQFECDCSSGPQDCGCGVFSGDISQTFDAVVRHVCRLHDVHTPMVRIHAYGKPSAEQLHTGREPDNQNSTSTVGAGLESSKKLLPTRMKIARSSQLNSAD
jgi:hypothetical protein